MGSDVGTISCVDPLASAVSCSVTLHSAPVVSLQSFSSRESRSSTTKLDLLAVHSDNVLVYVDGESLCGDGAPRLIKWVLPYQEIMDVAVYDSPIDDGSDEESMVYHVIAVGKSPMIANLVSNDVVSQFSIVQTGLDVAKMLTKSIVSYGASFLFRNSGQFDRRNSKEGDRQGFDTKAPEQLRIKTRIDDPFRTIEKIQLCPSRSFAILSDTFGRILLFDVEQFIIVRMWKGYRGAQCAWLSDSRFGGFFLCIYIPRRGQLEIWRMPFGAKVDAISVDANANLMCTYDESKSIPYARCFLITQKLEEICEIKLSDSAAHSVQSDSRLYSTIITSANQNEIS